MGNCLSLAHPTLAHPTAVPASYRKPKPKPKQHSHPHLLPPSQHTTRLITAIPSSPFHPPSSRHVHFAPTPPLPSHAHFPPRPKSSKPKSSLPRQAHFTPATKPQPLPVRVKFTRPIWDSPFTTLRRGSWPVSPLTVPIADPPKPREQKIKRKPVPPVANCSNAITTFDPLQKKLHEPVPTPASRTNATTTFLPSLRPSPSLHSSPSPKPSIPTPNPHPPTTARAGSPPPPPLPPKRALSIPPVPPKIPLHRASPLNPSHDKKEVNCPRISASAPYTPDLGRYECVTDSGKAVRSGGRVAVMRGALGGMEGVGVDVEGPRGLRRKEGGWFRRVSGVGGGEGGRRFWGARGR